MLSGPGSEAERDPERRAGLEALAASYEHAAGGLTIEIELPIEHAENQTLKQLVGARAFLLASGPRIPLPIVGVI